MGDPHNNRFGSHNNTGDFGRSGKKGKTHEEPNKLFNAIAGGVLLFVCASAGISIVGSAYSAITGVKDTVENVREVADYLNAPKKSKDGTYKFNDTKAFGADISAENVQETLEYFSELVDNGKEISKDVVFVDYSALDNEEKYQKKVIKKLSKYKDSVTFVFVNNGETALDTNEKDRAKKVISDNIELLRDTDFRSQDVYYCTNFPNSGESIFAVTFME